MGVAGRDGAAVVKVGDEVTLTGRVSEVFADTAIIELGDGSLAAVATSALTVADGDQL
jgi:2-phospho-L-lactate transferase/gluconeogenesis factor (CofD/UPF0052 family)